MDFLLPMNRHAVEPPASSLSRPNPNEISGADDELRTVHRRYNFGWYRVADAAKLKQMRVDDHGRDYEFGVPPPLVRKDLIAQMRAEAEIATPAIPRLFAANQPTVFYTSL